MTQPHTRLYPTLSQTFFKGSITGQINAIYGSYRTNPTRLTDYCRALANGDATLGHVPLSKAYCAKLAFHRELTSSLFIMCQTATLPSQLTVTRAPASTPNAWSNAERITSDDNVLPMFGENDSEPLTL